jgi:hypothetical protein
MAAVAALRELACVHLLDFSRNALTGAATRHPLRAIFFPSARNGT